MRLIVELKCLDTRQHCHKYFNLSILLNINKSRSLGCEQSDCPGQDWRNCMMPKMQGKKRISLPPNFYFKITSPKHRVSSRWCQKGKKVSLSLPFTIQQRRVRMDLTKVKSKKRRNQVNHFDRIPKDVLLFILSKMNEFKYLCQCSLVSKRFYSTVRLIRSVSLTLAQTESASQIGALLYKISSFSVEEINGFIRSSTSLKWLNLFLLLQKFRQLESISLNFTCPADFCSFSLFDLKLRFSDSGALVESLISIIPTRVYKVTGHRYHDRVTFCNTQVSSGCCTKLIFVLCLLLKCHSNKPWTLVLKDKALVAWRNSMFLGGGILGNTTTVEKKTGVISELRLPVSGYVMKEVQFLIEDEKLHSHSGSITECSTCRNESLWETRR